MQHLTGLNPHQLDVAEREDWPIKCTWCAEVWEIIAGMRFRSYDMQIAFVKCKESCANLPMNTQAAVQVNYNHRMWSAKKIVSWEENHFNVTFPGSVF